MRFAQAFNIDYEVNLSFKVLVFLLPLSYCFGGITNSQNPAGE